MNENDYMNMLYIFNKAYDNNIKLIISWSSGLKVRCSSITGIYETDSEPEDNNYVGEYAAVIGDIEILNESNDNSIEIYNNCIEISMKCIPNKISKEDGTVLWLNDKEYML